MFAISGSAFAAPAILGADAHSHSNSSSNSNSNAKAISKTKSNSNSDQKQGQLQGQQQGQLGVNGVGLGNGIGNDNSRTTIVGAKIPVATALAAPLITSNDTCMGSTSAGAQGITFGLSLGTTWTDANCVLRKDARFIANLGAKDLALSMMCAKEAVRMAIARLGTSIQMEICHITAEEVAMATSKPVTIADVNHGRTIEESSGGIDEMIDNNSD